MSFYKKIIKELELGFSLNNKAKDKFKVFVISCTAIWLNFIMAQRKGLKKQSKKWFLMCNNAYNDVVEFEVCKFIKNTKMKIAREQKIKNKKFRGYITTKKR